MPDLVLAARFVVALTLVVGASRKLGVSGRSRLSAALRSYAIVPSWGIAAVARALPWLELSLGLLIAAGVLLAPTSVCASLLFTSFAVAVGWHTRRGRRFSCGCGSGKTISWSLAIRDLVLGLIAAAVAAYPHAVLTAWAGPGWIRALTPTNWQAHLPVPLIVLILAAALRLISVGRSLTSHRPPGSL
jgi:Methylamine utilisation protein MauE